jgi:hypothetical protein
VAAAFAALMFAAPKPAAALSGPAGVAHSGPNTGLVQDVKKGWKKYRYRGYAYRPNRRYAYRSYAYRPYYRPYAYYRPYYRPYSYYGWGYPYWRRPGVSLWFGF